MPLDLFNSNNYYGSKLIGGHPADLLIMMSYKFDVPIHCDFLGSDAVYYTGYRYRRFGENCRHHIQVASSSETLITMYNTSRRQNPQNHNINNEEFLSKYKGMFGGSFCHRT
jgi:hypothetical protein